MARDTLGINAWLAGVIRALSRQSKQAASEQSAAKYEGVTPQARPLYSVNGNTLTGKFSYNTGQRKGSVVLGDSQEYIAAQAVQDEIIVSIEEVPDPEYYTDFFQISRPDGSSGFVRFRTPRRNASGLPIVDLVITSYPYTKGGRGSANTNTTELNKIASGAWMNTKLRDLIISEYTVYQEGNQLKTSSYVGGANVSPTNVPIEPYYCVDYIRSAIYLGAGSESLGARNGFNIVNEDIGANQGGFNGYSDINSWQYDFQANAIDNLFAEVEAKPVSVIPEYERVYRGGETYYSAYHVKRERGYHYVELRTSSNIHNYSTIEFSGFLEGQRLFTTVAATSTAPAVTPNGYSDGVGNGFWDRPYTYTTDCNSVQTNRNGWSFPRLALPNPTENIFIKANADVAIQGDSPIDYAVYFDRDGQNIFSPWFTTGLSVEQGPGSVAPFGSTTYPCYNGSFANHRFDGDGNFEGSVASADNFNCTVQIPDINNPLVLRDYHFHAPAYGTYSNLHIHQAQYTISGPHNKRGTCNQWHLTDKLHTESKFHIQVEAFRFLDYYKKYYRKIFTNYDSEGEQRVLVPSFFGLAHCEILHPAEHISPSGFQSAKHEDLDFSTLTYPDLVANGWIENYRPTSGIVGDRYITEDIKVPLISSWTTIETGYNLDVIAPPIIQVTSYFGDKKIETKVIAYEEDFTYFWPKVAVRLHGKEFWLGHPRNMQSRLYKNQANSASGFTLDAYGNSINVPGPFYTSTYPALWLNWSNPTFASRGGLNEWIYSAKETAAWFNPEEADEQLDVTTWVEWTTVERQIDFNTFEYYYIIRFWYGSLEAFEANPLPFSGYKEPTGQNDSALYDRNNQLFLLKKWDTRKQHLVNMYIDDPDLTYDDIVTIVAGENLNNQSAGTPITGNIGLQVQYNFWTDSILALGYEKSTKKTRPGNLVAGISPSNELRIIYNAPSAGVFGTVGSKILKFNYDVQALMSAGNAVISYADETVFPPQLKTKNLRYCLTAVQEQDIGLVSQLFQDEFAIRTAGGGVIKMNEKQFEDI